MLMYNLYEYNTSTSMQPPVPSEVPPEGGDQAPQPPVKPLNTDIAIPLKYLSNFWRSLDFPLINSEVELDLSWTKNCVLAENDADLNDATFQINNTKLYVPLVTWSINDNIKFLENMKDGFKRIVFWNKYRSQITT